MVLHVSANSMNSMTVESGYLPAKPLFWVLSHFSIVGIDPPSQKMKITAIYCVKAVMNTVAAERGVQML